MNQVHFLKQIYMFSCKPSVNVAYTKINKVVCTKVKKNAILVCIAINVQQHSHT